MHLEVAAPTLPLRRVILSALVLVLLFASLWRINFTDGVFSAYGDACGSPKKSVPLLFHCSIHFLRK
jgi:hypothetical protein